MKSFRRARDWGPLLIMALILPGCGEKISPGTATVKRPVVTGVVLETVALGPVSSYYETSGTVRARATSLIASRVMGTVTAVKVKEGEPVRSGQILALLDDRDAAQRQAAAQAAVQEARQALEAAGADRDLARVTFDRYKNLYQEKVITRQEMDEIESRRRKADLAYEQAGAGAARAGARLEEARISLGFTRIQAGDSGVITEKKIDAGSLALPGTPLLTLEDTSAFRLEASVDERLRGRVRVGTPVEITIDPARPPVKGEIGEVVPAVDPATRSFLIKINLKDPTLKSGLFGRVLIPSGVREALLVPRRALVEKGQLLGVYVVDPGNIMTYRLIKAGRPYGEKVEVLTGLRSGEKIVVQGLDRAVDGGLVKQ
jgi:RND family efflux transporter MFP subunit